MKKILFIANYRPASGGISTQVDMLNKMLQREGFYTSILSLKGNVWYRFKAFFRLLWIGKRYNVFHIHACSGRGFLPAVIGILVGKMLRRKIILTYHGGGARAFFKKRSWLVEFFLNKTHTNIVLSGFLKEVFDQYSIPCTIIPNIVELNTSLFVERKEIHPNFIGIRSFTPTYNIPCTLNAFKAVKNKYPDATLMLLGDGPLRESMEQYVKEQSIKDVSFIGVVPNVKIYDYLNKADIMLSSPLIDNMPVSLLEGFNAGTLVISSRVGGVPYMIEDGVNGLLFESRNSDEMASKMIEALENQEWTKKMISTAHDNLKMYSWEHNRNKYFEIYQ